MYKQGLRVKNVILGVQGLSIDGGTFSRCLSSSGGIDIRKILVVSKLSRYEFEKYKNKDLTETQLHNTLKNRGSDLEKLLYYHELHKRFENKLLHSFRNMGIIVKIANKINYTRSKVDWADIVIPVGGDGTFLLAASKVRDNRKLVVGFNSDPQRSEGFLCLPKHYSEHIDEAIERLKTGAFEWLMRTRIRATFSSGTRIEPQHLYEANKECEAIQEFREDAELLKASHGNVIPVLALNEVFLGETLSARASHLEISLDGGEPTGIKCSGLCVSTGTGSSSWHLSMNRLSVQTVMEIFEIMRFQPRNEEEYSAARVVELFNERLIFNATSDRLAYTVRDCISAEVWPNPKGLQDRGYAKEVAVKSRCYDGYLVVDGSVCFPFRDGALVTLCTHPEDSLRTVSFTD